jgi:hypothetical protein
MKSVWVALLSSIFLVACGGSQTPANTTQTVVSDSFTEADSTTLGSSWTEVSGMTGFQISGGRLRPVGGFGVAFRNDAITQNPVTASVSIEISGGTATSLQIHVLARSQARDNLNNAYSCVLISNRVQI